MCIRDSTQTVLLDEDSFKRITKQDKEDGEVVIRAYAPEYVSKVNGKPYKKTIPFSLPIHVRIGEDIEKTQKILDKLFKVPKGKIRELTIEGEIVEGYEQGEVSSNDIELSAELKELIEMGLYSEKEAREKMVVRGNKVSKLIFTRPYLQKDKDDAKNLKVAIDDDKYKPEDMIIPDVNDLNNEEKKDEEDPFADIETETNDDDWMQALGV